MRRRLENADTATTTASGVEAQLLCGDALSLLPTLKDRSVNLCLTSPPYALQRKRQYGGVSEREYPSWICKVMAALRPKLTDDGSVLLVIRSHVRNGVVSDYVLRTRLALREDGWNECEELIWLKPDAPPLGSKQRLRRTWEHILWFSKTPKPYVDLRANGGFSDRIGFVGSHRFRNGENPIATKRPSELQNGHARSSDVVTAHIADIEAGIRHPAMFPASLCEKLIRTFSREGDFCLDPFAGSGTALLSAQRLGRKFVGFDLNKEYVRIANDRLAAVRDQASGAPLDGSHPSSEVFRLKHDFPQRPRLRRILLLSKGLNESDVRVFEHILHRTVFSTEHRAMAPLSVNQLAANCGVNRSTAIRSMKRLQEHEYVVTVQDDEWWKHRESQVGPAPKLIERVLSSSGAGVVAATRSAVIRSGLHNLDCFVGLPRIESASVQLVLTDLPTGATANNWDTPLDLEALWQELKRILNPTGAVVMFAHFPFDKTLAVSNLPWLKHEWVWQKTKATGFLHAKDAPLRTHEAVLVFAPGTPLYNPQMTPVEPYVKKNGAAKRSPNYFGNRAGYVTVNSGLRHPTTVLQFAADADRIHPTQKPLALVEWFVRSYSNPGDVVCDPCAGSASTAIAAINASRQFVGFERDKAMFEKAARRIREHARTKAI